MKGAIVGSALADAFDKWRTSREPRPPRRTLRQLIQPTWRTMPVKLGSKLPPESAEARIEIIPLIDIMFFLLAAFMLVSLSMVNLKSVKVNLPTATTATLETKNDFITISVDKDGAIYLDKQPLGPNELALRLNSWHRTNENLRV